MFTHLSVSNHLIESEMEDFERMNRKKFFSRIKKKKKKQSQQQRAPHGEQLNMKTLWLLVFLFSICFVLILILGLGFYSVTYKTIL